ncbi:glycerol-3-phosphate acyltransferase [Alicyclobacillus vulcanalis]|uniref:Glycerol-3-phosphate acyltransferase PlsY n=1 Tax=Alicyclobacillus vulcanalis TaxID=252246 RepID=A0A1N7LIB1_9BACL|nr:glycerol-3-phosphate acyltransferase [Alicyclobacillus vulcanalis]SIS73585.1 glycerol-3-phosphate acyltransferase PlsY [Alicyclobacillus vulcanalis]
MTPWGWLGVCVASFLVGACPFAVWLSRCVHRDPRSFGDGNPGAANAFRAAGMGLGSAVLVLDVAKGFLPGYVAFLHAGSNALFAAMAAALPVYGHRFSPFLRGRGGIGLASWVGAVAGFLGPLAAIALGAGFAVGLAVRRQTVWAAVALGAAVLLGSTALVPSLLWPAWHARALWPIDTFCLLTAPLVIFGYWVRKRPSKQV